MTRLVAPITTPVQFDRPQLRPALVQVTELIRAALGRERFGVNGSGLTVAVLDTGINPEHIDFSDRIAAQFNATEDNEGTQADARDGNGHGTNVSGIVCASGDHVGIAPGSRVAAVKVLSNSGGGSFDGIDRGLQWVLDNRLQLGISAVCMSLGDGSNYQSDTDQMTFATSKLIKSLHDARVAVAVAAGNDFFRHAGRQGMSYPGIVREAVSVGAVFDADVGQRRYQSGATAYLTAADRITPFSQRLHPTVAADCATDIFAPGASVTSTGIRGSHGESTQDGTSQATPVIVGVMLLLQELYKKHTGSLPAVAHLVEWMRRGAVRIIDGDDENDNVPHTGKEYLRVDVHGALASVLRYLEIRMLESATPLDSLIWE